MDEEQDRARELRLQDGRRLAYCVRGNPRAQPVVWFDGAPGSRLTAVLDDAMCERFDLCSVSFDRPGYGRSDVKPRRRIADSARDVTQLTAHLGWSQWAAVGYSGGGPHALACAALLPEQVVAALAVATVGPPHELTDWWAGAHPSARATHDALSNDPGSLDAQLRATRARLAADPLAGIAAMLGDGGAPSDAAWLAHPENHAMFDASLREGLRPGHHGWHDDEVALHGPWGFSLEDIPRPVRFLHGSLDPIAPIAHVREMAERIPAAEIDEIPDAGHLAVLGHLDQTLPFIRQRSPNHDKEMT